MRLLACVLFAAATATVMATPEASSLAGKWTLHYSISGNEGDLACTFEQTESDFTGTCKGDQGDVSVTGKVDDTRVTFQYKTEYNGDPLTVIYTGKLESPSKVSGTVDVQPMGVDGDFTLTQSK